MLQRHLQLFAECQIALWSNYAYRSVFVYLFLFFIVPQVHEFVNLSICSWYFFSYFLQKFSDLDISLYNRYSITVFISFIDLHHFIWTRCFFPTDPVVINNLDLNFSLNQVWRSLLIVVLLMHLEFFYKSYWVFQVVLTPTFF